jgi:hypothetical protein
VFAAEAEDAAWFSWFSEPPPPPEAMRMGSFEFDAPNWFAEDAAIAACSTELDWPIA